MIKAPRIFAAYEEVIRARVREKITRGHADVYVSLSDKREKKKTLELDEGVAASYIAAARRLSQLSSDIPFDVTATSLLRMPDVVVRDESQAADDELIAALTSALSSALENLNAMRFKEGEKLRADMLSRMDRIEQLVKMVAERAPLVAEDYRAKLKEKIEKYLQGVTYDEGKLLTEVALFSDKSNIDEELTRLKSHIEQFRDICRSPIVGRKLELKNEIEKIREQVQNVE